MDENDRVFIAQLPTIAKLPRCCPAAGCGGQNAVYLTIAYAFGIGGSSPTLSAIRRKLLIFH
jgi:hypothetical protein